MVKRKSISCTFFMHTDAERNYAAKAARVRRGEKRGDAECTGLGYVMMVRMCALILRI